MLWHTDAKGKTSTETNTETKPNTEAKKPNDNTPEKPTDVDNADIKPKSKKEDVATKATTETSTKAATETNIKTKKKTQTNSKGITPEEIEALKTDEVFVDKRTISQMKKLRSKNQKELIEIYNDPNTGTYKKMAAFRLYFDIGRNV